MSILFREPGQDVPSLALIGALAVTKGLHSTLAVKALVRWPNDVMHGSGKLAGVSVEAKTVGNELEYAILGMGINANFPSNLLREIRGATTLQEICNSVVDRERVISSILAETEELNRTLTSDGPEAIVKELERFECSRGAQVIVRLQDKEISGVFASYDGLDKVRLLTTTRGSEVIETASVVSVEYVSA
jgi:BirA family biotin operon repressor/biotin-[acetyl-CoA-carboxylase] ligase